jgi:D-sedoheptulose 7-phosphate isomerase
MSAVQAWLTDYLTKQSALYAQLPVTKIDEIIHLLVEAHTHNRGVYAFGNGGSAANCSHFATDLGKSSSDILGKPFKVVSLNDNVSWITAIGNDYCYEDIFLRQLKNVAVAGDLAITLSVSGNSPNCIKAMEWAREQGLKTIAFVGGKRGKLAEICEHVIVVPEVHYGRAEDVQMTLCHLLCYVFVEKIIAANS